MNDELPRFEAQLDPRPHDNPWPDMAWPPVEGTALRGSFVELTKLDPRRESQELWSLLSDDQVWSHLPFRPTGPEDLATHLSARESKGFYIWGVRLVRAVASIQPGTLVGMTSYLDIAPSDARIEVGGTAYAPATWASPVNPEAKLLLLEYAFESLHVGRVQIKTDIRNVRSQQAIARLGAQYEGTLRRAQRRADGTLRDSVMFSIIAEEWPSVRERLQARLDAFA